MKIVKGDILEIEKGFICQQVNCKGVMGSGLALSIKTKYPIVCSKYKSLVRNTFISSDLLGDIQIVDIDKDLKVINLFAQFSYGTFKRQTLYKYFEECLIKIKKLDTSLPIYFPYGIGCGLGGGSWNVISKLIEEHLPNSIIIKKEK